MDLDLFSYAGLKKLSDQVRLKIDERYIEAENNFNNKTRKLLNVKFSLCLPISEKKHLCVNHNSLYKNEYGSYKIKILIRQESITFEKYTVCICPSPVYCHSQCYANRDKIDEIIYQHNFNCPNGDVTKLDTYFPGQKTVDQVKFLSDNFEYIYEGYFRDLDGV